MIQTNPPDAIVATIVAPDRKLDTLPKVFGVRHMMRAESLANAWMRRLCETYSGSDWDYYTTSNDGFFMVPQVGEKLRLSWAMTEGELSAEAAGIAACMYAWQQLCNETEIDAHIELYYALRDFAKEHAESSLIMGLTD